MDSEEIRKRNQELFDMSINRHKILLIKKPRNIGMTSMVLEYCYKYPTKNFLLIVENEDTKVKLKGVYYRMLGNFVKSNLKIVTTGVHGIFNSPHKYDHVFVDECAKMSDKTWKLVKDNIDEYDRLCLIGTPNDAKGFFYEIYTNVLFRCINMENPNDAEEYMKLCKNDLDKFRNEYLGEFKRNAKDFVSINNIQVEELLYILMVERIRKVEVDSNYIYTYSISDYIRALIKLDVRDNVLNLGFDQDVFDDEFEETEDE